MPRKTAPVSFRGAARVLAKLCVGAIAAFHGVAAQAAPDGEADLTGLSIEQLMNVEVTSVAKKPQKLRESAAAIHVISSTDIRRSTATSIPELLRSVPGLHVARVDANKWAITARGFNGVFANKLLVLIDGRSVYTPIFSGVYWEVQDTLLEDVERIEVIRGPGASVWGANAVNGVINIITKSAMDTQGGLLTGIAGTEENANVAARYGSKLGAGGYFRVYAKHLRRDKGAFSTGAKGADDWYMSRTGFRYDLHPDRIAGRDAVTIQGEAYDGSLHHTLTVPALTAPYSLTTNDTLPVNGQHLLARWDRRVGENRDYSLKAYISRAERADPNFMIEEFELDLEFQNRLRVGSRHDVVWGLGYRLNIDDTASSFAVTLDPGNRTAHLFSAFVQDEIDVLDDLALTVGSKVEHNFYTGLEIQPTVRGTWSPAPEHTIWGAISRAVRTPSRSDADLRINATVIPPVGAGALPILVSVFGSDAFDSENVIAYELGYRSQPTPSFGIDVAGFYNRYSDLRTNESGASFVETTPAPTHLVSPTTADNNMEGRAYGIELGADWHPMEWWRLRAAYTLFDLELNLVSGSTATASTAKESRDPRHQFNITSQITALSNVEIDTFVRVIDDLPERGVEQYVELDLRLGWRPLANVELSIVGRNLLQRRHAEFIPSAGGTTATEAERSVYGKVRVTF